MQNVGRRQKPGPVIKPKYTWTKNIRTGLVWSTKPLYLIWLFGCHVIEIETVRLKTFKTTVCWKPGSKLSKLLTKNVRQLWHSLESGSTHPIKSRWESIRKQLAMSPILSQFLLYHASNSLSRHGCCPAPRMCRPNRCFGWPLMVWSKLWGSNMRTAKLRARVLARFVWSVEVCREWIEAVL